LQVFVRDNNVDQALRVLKKKMQREGVFREMKRRKAYEKPSERKTREGGGDPARPQGGAQAGPARGSDPRPQTAHRCAAAASAAQVLKLAAGHRPRARAAAVHSPAAGSFHSVRR
jgi:small subunit ribosomal protein S21